MEKSYKRDWFTRAVYIGGGGLIIGGGVAILNGMLRDGIGLIGYGAILDGLAYFHDRWKQKQLHKKDIKKYTQNDSY